MRRMATLLLPALLAALLAPAVRAGDEGSSASPILGTNVEILAVPPDGAPCWDQGSWSVQALSGYYAMSSLGPGSVPAGLPSRGRTHIDYIPLHLRLGYEFPG